MPIKFLHRNNPKIDDDLIVEFLESDSEFLYQRKLDYVSLKKKLQPNNFFMTLKQQYINFTHLVTKNAVVATAVMLLALGTVSASALETFAPQEYKPSTQVQNIFGANKQKDQNPYTALKPDSENDVVSFDSCDLAIKHPKQINSVPVFVSQIGKTVEGEQGMQSYTEGQERQEVKLTDQEKQNVQYGKTTQGEQPIEGQEKYETAKIMETITSYYTGSVNINSEASGGTKSFKISCYSEKQDVNELLPSRNYTKINKEELRQKYGWFLTQSDLTDVILVESSDKTEQIVSFRYAKKLYTLTFSPDLKNPNLAGVFPNQVQLQFNSLVKNEPNSKIQDKKEGLQTNNSGISGLDKSDGQNEVVILDDCDLSVKYKKGTEFFLSKNEIIFGTKCQPQSINPGVESVSCDPTKKDVFAEDGTMGLDKNNFEQKTVQDIPYLTDSAKEQIKNSKVYLFSPAKPVEAYSFVGNKNFVVSIIRDPNKSMITSVQFNSLAPNTVNSNSIQTSQASNSESLSSSSTISSKPTINEKKSIVTNFEDCTISGGIVAVGSPAKCYYNGKEFVE